MYFICPFQENCPGGCPCPNYECKHTTNSTDGYAILALNTNTPFDNAVLIDFDG